TSTFPAHCLSSPLPSSPELSTLSLHDALPIFMPAARAAACAAARCVWVAHCSQVWNSTLACSRARSAATVAERSDWRAAGHDRRSEEHTSELQSPYDLVCRLLLVKKKQQVVTV